MNRLVIPAVLAATGMLAAAAWSQNTPAFQNHRYFATPLEKDPTREVGMQSVTMPPGAGNQFHRHPGDHKGRPYNWQCYRTPPVVILVDPSIHSG